MGARGVDIGGVGIGNIKGGVGVGVTVEGRGGGVGLGGMGGDCGRYGRDGPMSNVIVSVEMVGNGDTGVMDSLYGKQVSSNTT